MEKNKEKFLSALRTNNDRLDEISLGQNIGLTEADTKKIIEALLAENKIEFKSFGLCSYSATK